MFVLNPAAAECLLSPFLPRSFLRSSLHSRRTDPEVERSSSPGRYSFGGDARRAKERLLCVGAPAWVSWCLPAGPFPPEGTQVSDKPLYLSAAVH